MSHASSRAAFQQGTLYPASAADLQNELNEHLSRARQAAPAMHSPTVSTQSRPNPTASELMRARAIIVPHGPFASSASIASFAYQFVDRATTRRIIILGPSHYDIPAKCLLPVPAFQLVDTPLLPLAIDQDECAELLSKSAELFSIATVAQDSIELSLEAQFPFISHIMQSSPCTIVPILVGSLSTRQEALLGSILATYLDSPDNLIVISTDLCHFGQRFNFTVVDTDVHADLNCAIAAMDLEAIRAIESHNLRDFKLHLDLQKNSICGRHIVSAFLHALSMTKHKFSTSFQRYVQSNRCKSAKDSCTSYASAVVYETPQSANHIALLSSHQSASNDADDQAAQGLPLSRVRELCEATANQSTSFSISSSVASSSNLSSKLLPRLTRRVQLPVANLALLELQKQKMSLPASDRPDSALVRPSSFTRILYPEQADQVTAVIQSALEIAKQCTKFESDAGSQRARILFVPHAAYWQVANLSAFAYQQLPVRSVRRVIVLGACHEGIPSTLDSCFLPAASLISLDTPLGSLLLDSDTMKRLRAMDHFRQLDAEADASESAVEAQLPWIAHMLHGQDCMVVPILLGQLSAKTEDALAANLSEFLSDPHTVVIVSSDWTQFGDDYMYVRPAGTSQQQAKRQRELQERIGKSDQFAPLSDDINDAIAKMDLSMVHAIEACDNQSFCQSINSSGASICGRHAISAVLKAANRQSNKFQIRFQRYAQQRLCHSTADACISFLSGVACEWPGEPTPSSSDSSLDSARKAIEQSTGAGLSLSMLHLLLNPPDESVNPSPVKAKIVIGSSAPPAAKGPLQSEVLARLRPHLYCPQDIPEAYKRNPVLLAQDLVALGHAVAEQEAEIRHQADMLRSRARRDALMYVALQKINKKKAAAELDRARQELRERESGGIVNPVSTVDVLSVDMDSLLAATQVKTQVSKAEVGVSAAGSAFPFDSDRNANIDGGKVRRQMRVAKSGMSPSPTSSPLTAPPPAPLVLAEDPDMGALPTSTFASRLQTAKLLRQQTRSSFLTEEEEPVVVEVIAAPIVVKLEPLLTVKRLPERAWLFVLEFLPLETELLVISSLSRSFRDAVHNFFAPKRCACVLEHNGRRKKVVESGPAAGTFAAMKLEREKTIRREERKQRNAEREARRQKKKNVPDHLVIFESDESDEPDSDVEPFDFSFGLNGAVAELAMSEAIDHLAVACSNQLRSLTLVDRELDPCVTDSHLDSVALLFSSLRYLHLDGCSQLSDEALMPLLTARAHALSGLSLRHFSRASNISFLPFEVMMDLWQLEHTVDAPAVPEMSETFDPEDLDSQVAFFLNNQDQKTISQSVFYRDKDSQFVPWEEVHFADLPPALADEKQLLRLFAALPRTAIDGSDKMILNLRCVSMEVGSPGGVTGVDFVTDKLLKALQSAVRMEKLSLAGGVRWTDKALFKLLDRLPLLSSLDLSRCVQQVTDTFLAALSTHASHALRTLLLANCSAISDTCFEILLAPSWRDRLELIDLSGISSLSRTTTLRFRGQARRTRVLLDGGFVIMDIAKVAPQTSLNANTADLVFTRSRTVMIGSALGPLTESHALSEKRGSLQRQQTMAATADAKPVLKRAFSFSETGALISSVASNIVRATYSTFPQNVWRCVFEFLPFEQELFHLGRLSRAFYHAFLASHGLGLSAQRKTWQFSPFAVTKVKQRHVPKLLDHLALHDLQQLDLVPFSPAIASVQAAGEQYDNLLDHLAFHCASSLRRFSARRCPSVEDRHLMRLATFFPSIQRVALERCCLSDDGLASMLLTYSHQLTHLELRRVYSNQTLSQFALTSMLDEWTRRYNPPDYEDVLGEQIKESLLSRAAIVELHLVDLPRVLMHTATITQLLSMITPLLPSPHLDLTDKVVRSLRRLSIDVWRPCDDDIRSLAQSDVHASLRQSCTEAPGDGCVTDEGLRLIGSCEQLEELSLYGQCLWTCETMLHTLRRLKYVSKVDLGRCRQVSDEFLTSLFETHAYQISHLNLESCPRITDVTLKTLLKTFALRHVDISFNFHFTKDGFLRFRSDLRDSLQVIMRAHEHGSVGPKASLQDFMEVTPFRRILPTPGQLSFQRRPVRKWPWEKGGLGAVLPGSDYNDTVDLQQGGDGDLDAELEQLLESDRLKPQRLPPKMWQKILEFLPIESEIEHFSCLSRSFCAYINQHNIRAPRELLQLKALPSRRLVSNVLRHATQFLISNAENRPCSALEFSECSPGLDAMLCRAVASKFRLRSLILDRSFCEEVDDAALSTLLVSQCPTLQSLTLSGIAGCNGNHFTDKPLLQYARALTAVTNPSACQELRLIDVPSTMCSESTMLTLLQSLPGRPHNLRRLALECRGSIGGGRGNAQNIGSNERGFDVVSDVVLRAIGSECVNAERLSVAGMRRWSEATMCVVLNQLPHVCELDLSRCTQVTDRLIIELARILGKRLRALRLAFCTQLTDASLEALSVHCAGGALILVDLTRVWSITQDAVDKLKFSFPKARVYYETYLENF